MGFVPDFSCPLGCGNNHCVSRSGAEVQSAAPLRAYECRMCGRFAILEADLALLKGWRPIGMLARLQEWVKQAQRSAAPSDYHTWPRITAGMIKEMSRE